MGKMNNEYAENGFIHFKKALNPDAVTGILNDAKSIFIKQFISRGYTTESEFNEDIFNSFLYKLFEEDTQVFSNCGKQIQHLISLHRLSLSNEIVGLLSDFGLSFPNISTRPVLFFNHPRLAKETVYYKVDAHQDWKSMQGSLNSVVVWLPLVNINKDLGALQILPGSHKLGLITNKVEYGFGMVDLTEEQKSKLLTVEVEVGDILVFSSFLIHQSGENITDKPRWSCHFRYNDLNETTFIERGYPHAYIYKPIDEMLTKDFPSQKQLNSIFYERQ